MTVSFERKIKAAKSRSIVDFIESKNIPVKKRHRNYVCSSPFSSDSNWSFIIFPNNFFCDYSNGYRGDIIQLYQLFENVDFATAVEHLSTNQLLDTWEPKNYKVADYKQYDFDLDYYLTNDSDEVARIAIYALSRNITKRYYPCKTFTRYKNQLIEKLGLGFPHVNLEGEIVGIQIRLINPEPGQSRFRFRGTQGYYVSDVNYKRGGKDEEIDVYLVESETSANSLAMVLEVSEQKACVISFGGVAHIPPRVPDVGAKINNTYLIIDYDGDEEMFQKRLTNFQHLKAKPIKMELPKGEDINSLYSNGQVSLIKKLLWQNQTIQNQKISQ